MVSTSVTFNFHQYTDFYGQYSLKRGRKVYSYCFDVRYTPKQDCQPPFSASLPINPIVPGSGMGTHGVMFFFDLFRIYMFLLHSITQSHTKQTRGNKFPWLVTLISNRCLVVNSSDELNAYIKTTGSAQLEPHSWLQPHQFKTIIHPQSRTGIEMIEPHRELNPILADLS